MQVVVVVVVVGVNEDATDVSSIGVHTNLAQLQLFPACGQMKNDHHEMDPFKPC